MTKYWILLLSMLFSLQAIAEVKPMIRIEGARFRPLKIAIPEFSALNSEAKAISTTLTQNIRANLELSGVFNVVDPRSYIADAKKESLSRSSIKMSDWTNVGAEGLVKAEMQVQGQDVIVDVAIHQVGIAKESETKRYTVKNPDMRKLGQKIADDIYRYFTGEPGPFSSQIVAVKETPQGKQIIAMDIDGQGQRQLTKASNINLLPVVTPEGDAVFFTSYINKNPDLFSINMDGTNLKVISSQKGLNTGPAFSPDKKKIALTLSKDGDSEIYVMDRDGKNLKRLTNSTGIDTSPSWSPDGKQIAFISARSGNPQVYLMDADGSNPKRLTFQGKYNQMPRFSPRGDYIAFTGRDELNVFDVFLLEVSSGKVTRVTQNQGSNEDPYFAPNGRLLVFTSTRNGSRDLHLASLDGSFQRRLTQNGKYWTPAFGPAR